MSWSLRRVCEFVLFYPVGHACTGRPIWHMHGAMPIRAAYTTLKLYHFDASANLVRAGVEMSGRRVLRKVSDRLLPWAHTYKASNTTLQLPAGRFLKFGLST